MKAKTCFACEVEKSVACFAAANSGRSPDKLAISCIECNLALTEKQKATLYAAHWRKNNLERSRNTNKRTHIQKSYGISIERYRALLEEQKAVCAICGNTCTSVSKFGKTFDLAVDHDHVIGTLRGLLCRNCNHGLDNFKDDTKRLEAAIAYLKKHQ